MATFAGAAVNPTTARKGTEDHPGGPSDPHCAREAIMFHLSSRGRVLASALIAFSLAFVSTVAAEVRIAENADVIQVEADNGSLDEILTKLSVEHELRIRTTEALQARISGTYRGSLRTVVSRLLDGYNYVIQRKREHGALSIIVLGLKETTPTPPGIPSPLPRVPNANLPNTRTVPSIPSPLLSAPNATLPNTRR
jgi:hypothetical protein